MTKWFHFDNGSNPYGVYDDRDDKFFKMILAWQPDMIDNNTFQCHEPTPAYYTSQNYNFKKNALRTFAIEYQSKASCISSSWEDVAWFSNFFEKYGRRYGLLTEFRENGIC